MGAVENVRDRVIIVVSSSLLLASLAVVPARAQPWREDPVRIVPVSNRADLVSGDDVLIEIELPDWADMSGMTVGVDGRDVTDAISVADDGRIYGLIDSLELDRNRITVSLADGSGAYLDVTNHSLGGPIFSGPHIQPWFCRTEEEDLGAPQDEKCVAPPVVTYLYMPEGGDALEPYDPASPPSDVAMTTTDLGKTVPFIVRVEKGSMNRGIYGFAGLWDLANPDQPWAQDNWDHKITTEFGGDCGAEHSQVGSGHNTDAPGGFNVAGLNPDRLGRGFAQLTHGLFTMGTNCNSMVAAETLMMMRERMTEVFGEIRYAITQGCSGGSMMQLEISNSYPGLLDGINPSCTYPDMWTTWSETTDCGLLQRVFTFASPHLWADEQQRADVSGHFSNSTCAAWDATYVGVVIDPTGVQCQPANEEWAYDPDTNPEGTRCAVADYQVNIFGTRDESVWSDVEQQIGRGFANRILDNVGVQYGLVALQSGKILPAQFTDLNEKAGGYDIDGNWQPGRHVADPVAVGGAYRAGRITQGHNLDQVAIIDAAAGIVNTPYLDNVEFHTSFRVYMLDDRLTEYVGSTANHAIARGPRPDAFDVLDEWMAAVDADTNDLPRAEKIALHRPSSANDDCQVQDQRFSDPDFCRTIYPYFGDPRIAAGGPSTDDVIKCQLKPLDRDDPDFTNYGVTFTDLEWGQLEAAFPDGVCDYTKPSIGDQPVVAWQTYADGPGGGRPLGQAPVSVPFAPPQPSSGDDDAPLPTTGGGMAVVAALVVLAVIATRRRVIPG